MRPAVLYFNRLTPDKGHCSCPVGASELCCHVLTMLLFLKDYHDTNEKILELACTQQLQKFLRFISHEHRHKALNYIYYYIY